MHKEERSSTKTGCGRTEVTMVAKRGMKNKFKRRKTKQNKMSNENGIGILAN